jgi:hypothetical protein
LPGPAQPSTPGLLEDARSGEPMAWPAHLAKARGGNVTEHIAAANLRSKPALPAPPVHTSQRCTGDVRLSRSTTSSTLPLAPPPCSAWTQGSAAVTAFAFGPCARGVAAASSFDVGPAASSSAAAPKAGAHQLGAASFSAVGPAASSSATASVGARSVPPPPAHAPMAPMPTRAPPPLPPPAPRVLSGRIAPPHGPPDAWGAGQMHAALAAVRLNPPQPGPPAPLLYKQPPPNASDESWRRWNAKNWNSL